MPHAHLILLHGDPVAEAIRDAESMAAEMAGSWLVIRTTDCASNPRDIYIAIPVEEWRGEQVIHRTETAWPAHSGGNANGHS